MAPKRSHDEAAARPAKRQRSGFDVGPANLPDGLHRRKVQKIKQDLIAKAKIKKQYAKLKTQAEPQVDSSVYHRDDGSDEVVQQSSPATLEPHPERVKMLQEDPAVTLLVPRYRDDRRHHRSQPFQKEQELDQKRRLHAEERQKARELAERDRAKRMDERDRFRRVMAKARGAGPGQRKLGRESTVLLEKAKRLVGSSS